MSDQPVIALSKQQMDSAQEFANATMAALKLPKGVHPPTVIAGSARMAGTYLFRSFGLKLSGVLPGQVVLSEEANEKAPLLAQIAGSILARVGVRIANSPPEGLQQDPKAKPMLEFLASQRALEAAYAPIQRKFNFTDEQTAQAVAVATALLIRHCAKVLDPNLAFGIAVSGFIEGSKTVPERYDEGNR
jgi:hypothetical protein